MSFGNELKDFVQGFQTGMDWMDKREERKLDRAERKEDRQYRRDRDAKADQRYDNEWEYKQGQDALNWDWKRDQQDYTRTNDARTWDRQDRLDERQSEMDRVTVDRWGRADAIAEGSLEETRRRNDMAEDEMRLRHAQATGAGGALPTEGDLVNPNTGARPTEAIPSGEGGDDELGGNGGNDFLQRTSWTPAGGSNFQPSSGRRTRRGTMGMTGQDIAQSMVYDLNRDFGMPMEVGIGVVGQLAGETGGFKYHQEINPMVKGSRGGGGYAQWTGPRRRQFEAWADERGLDYQSYEANYGFLRHELSSTSEGRIMEKLKGVRDPIQAGRIFTGSAASRSGFLRPGVVNTAGRDRWTNRVAGLFGGGTRQVRAARGGMIEEQPAPMFDEDDPLGDEYAGMGDEELAGNASDDTLGAVPAPTQAPRGAIPDPSYEGGEDDTPTPKSKGLMEAYKAGREAVREGANKLVKDAGISASEAIKDPQLEQARQDYLKGYGAAPAQMMRRVADMIDPDRKMSPAERNLAAMGNVYTYFMNNGEIEKAQAAAASMIQFHRQAANQFVGLAQLAAGDGRLDDAGKAIVAAYTNVPDGRDLSIEKDGENYKITFTDVETGEEMEQTVLNPSQFAEQVMKFNPGTFDVAILDAAAIPPSEYKQLKGEALESVSANVDTYMSENENISSLPPEQQRAIRQAATSIASFEENGIPAADAVDLLTDAMAVNSDAPADQRKPGFTMKPVRGNPDLVTVTTVNGDRFVVTKGAGQRLESLYGKNVERQEKVDDDKRESEENDRQRMEMLRKFSGAIEENGNDHEAERARKRMNIGRLSPPAERGGRVTAIPEPDPARFGTDPLPK